MAPSGSAVPYIEKEAEHVPSIKKEEDVAYVKKDEDAPCIKKEEDVPHAAKQEDDEDSDEEEEEEDEEDDEEDEEEDEDEESDEDSRADGSHGEGSEGVLYGYYPGQRAYYYDMADHMEVWREYIAAMCGVMPPRQPFIPQRVAEIQR